MSVGENDKNDTSLYQEKSYCENDILRKANDMKEKF